MNQVAHLLRRRTLSAVLVVAAGPAVYWGGQRWMDHHHTDAAGLRQLLGAAAEPLLGWDATLAAWVPDANYRPQAWYAMRPLDAAALHRLAAQQQLVLRPPPAAAEALWQLPAGVVLPGWRAATLPAEGTLQARGTLGQAAVWLRWHGGTLYLVALVSGP